jgi:hypothetical protein
LAFWFQRRRFLNIFPIGSYVKTKSADGGQLGPDLHPRWPPSADILLTYIKDPMGKMFKTIFL